MNVYRNSDAPIEEPVGSSFVVSLESMPSAGYSWTADFDDGALKLNRSQDFTPRSTAIGAGGDEEFEFRAKRSGDTRIRMIYQRPWDEEPRKTIVFRVHISG